MKKQKCNYTTRGVIVLHLVLFCAAFSVYAGEGQVCVVQLNKTEDGYTLQVKSEKEVHKTIPFDGSEIVQITPHKNMQGVRILGEIEFGLVPAFLGNDLVYDPRKHPAAGECIHIPSENFLVGLLKGNDGMLVATWPEGDQKVKLLLGQGGGEARLFRGAEVQLDGKSIYLTMLSAPGIWHKEELKPSHLEKRIDIGWKNPFPAKWLAQLSVEDIASTLCIGGGGNYWGELVGGKWWRPVYFQKGTVRLNMTKRIPPVGDVLFYFLEKKGKTPIASPVDIVKETLGADFCKAMLDLEGRKLRPRGEVKIFPNATCPIRDRIKEIFMAKREVIEKEVVKAYTDDIQSFFVWQKARADEYLAFSKEIQEFCEQTKKDKPELAQFLAEIEGVVKEIEVVCSRVPEDVTTEHLARLMAEINELTQEHKPGNLATLARVQFTRISGAYDGPNRVFGRTLEKLLEKAGHACADQPQAVKTAEEVRRRARRCLRHPVLFERQFRLPPGF